MLNIWQTIDARNKRTLQSGKKADLTQKSCNCRNPSDSPMSGKCLKESMVYLGTVLAA